MYRTRRRVENGEPFAKIIFRQKIRNSAELAHEETESFHYLLWPKLLFFRRQPKFFVGDGGGAERTVCRIRSPSGTVTNGTTKTSRISFEKFSNGCRRTRVKRYLLSNQEYGGYTPKKSRRV